MMWNREYEAMSRDALRKHQSEKLKQVVQRVYDRVPFYRNKMDAIGVKPRDIVSIRDIVKLPFTTKDEMRDVYPYGLCASDMRDIVEIHTSSGTTGKPVVDAYTQNDIDIWSEVMARTLTMGGTTRDDIVHNAYGYGLFTGGLGVHYGARRIGATVIPISGGNTKRQLAVMKDFKSSILTCTPSYSLYLAEVAREEGIDFESLKIRAGMFGAEPWSENMRTEIQNKLHCKAFDIYGLTEIIGPGVGIECHEQAGLHIFEDHFLVEIVDPETDEVLPDGQEGELIITTLTKQAFPMIRYRTHDITSIIPERCACGRTIRRISRIRSRSDDMMIFRGVNVFPSQIEAALLSVEETVPHYQILLTRKGGLDQIEVQVEVTKEMFGDRISELEGMQARLTHAIDHITGLRVPVRLVEPNTIARSEGKAKRVIDNRNQ